MPSSSSSEILAKGLGYLVGFGSIMLYTPIAVRLLRQKHADGLVIATWWLKTTSYLISIVYYLRKSYDLSTYAETLVICLEALVILLLVAVYQRKYLEASFWVCSIVLTLFVVWERTIAPETVVATGQLASAVVNVVALIPQFWHNYCHKTKGDYSPLTAGLAVAGCGIRIFTTMTLNDSDAILMLTFFLAFCTNAALLLQIVYYGVSMEGLSVWQVLAADIVTTHNPVQSEQHESDNENENAYGGLLEIPNANSSENLVDRRPLSQQKREII